MSWQLQEAKQKFSELVRRAQEDGPQTVTRHGEEVVVVLSIRDYQQLSGAIPDFKEFLMSGPDTSQLDIRRSRERSRIVEL